MNAENPELDEITRLLEVEKQAESLIEDAMTEADKLMTESRQKFNEQFKAKNDILTSKLTEEYNSKIEEIKENHKKEIESFKSSLEKKEIKQSEFNALLNKILFASA